MASLPPLSVSNFDESEDSVDSPGLLLFNEEFSSTDSPALSAAQLRESLGVDDLSSVESASISADCEVQSFDQIGEFLPSLRRLVLVDSVLNSFRDLGNSLFSLEFLSCERCGLTDLDGLERFHSLRILSAAFNQISDLSPLQFLPNLVELDFRFNFVSDLDSIEFLSEMKNLKILKLENNPINARKFYRRIVGSRVSQLSELDGEKLSAEDRKSLTPAEEREIDQNYKNEEISYAPTSAHQRRREHEMAKKRAEGNAEWRAIEAGETQKISNNSNNSTRPQTAADRLFASAAARPSTAAISHEPKISIASDPQSMAEQLESASALTYGGGSMAGNFAAALRNRRKMQKSEEKGSEMKEIEAKNGNFAGKIPKPPTSGGQAQSDFRSRRGRANSINSKENQIQTPNQEMSN